MNIDIIFQKIQGLQVGISIGYMILLFQILKNKDPYKRLRVVSLIILGIILQIINLSFIPTSDFAILRLLIPFSDTVKYILFIILISILGILVSSEILFGNKLSNYILNKKNKNK